MMEQQCGQVRELIPDVASGRATASERAAVEAHMSGCDECRAELDLVTLLLVSRAEAPTELAGRIVSAVRRDRMPPSRPWWGITAAAVAALAVGIGIASEPTTTADPVVPAYAQEAEEGTVWLSDDGLLAGAPLLEELSDEALEQLLDELMTGSAGGAA